jgi:hypothetical protein
MSTGETALHAADRHHTAGHGFTRFQSAVGWTNPVPQAQAAISTRLRTSSLLWMLVRWDLTVLSEMNSSAAISVLVRPLAIA